MNPLLQAVVGYFLLLVLAWTVSSRRSAIPWRTVLAGIALQWMLALLIFRLPGVREIFAACNDALLAIAVATREGTKLVFGFLGGASLPYAENAPGASFVLAFQALPVVLVMSALSALLYHWRVLPLLVQGFSLLLERTLGVGGAVGMSTAANVFVGMIEAPLLIRPYLASVDRGEMFIILTGGMAGVAGTVMALYASILGPVVPDALGHILAASFISAPAAIVFAVIMEPPAGPPTGRHLDLPRTDSSSMEAVTRGTGEGVSLLINIVAMLIVLVALVSLANQALGLLPGVDGAPLSLQRLLGWLMAPVAWMAGVPWGECAVAGALLGTKTVLNELLAYLDMAQLPPAALAPRSRIIMTYALCGFANLGSLGILLGGMCAIAPQRRSELVELGPLTLISGTLATLSCGSMVAMWL
ncbi:MAG TPA: nucleoside transporter C-terminal domain-containing protein [Accumulibacter sp.]|uniref:NupC/NupG family nucleoside CNT transporter n=1 Tax=Accumulibacter sp. TaxID=2053492 RepID=UPI0025FCE2C2|nr:nucleoside transporter C-terminal domain-containing protein [Accumulibacter sp.]MCM8598949.1 nucleoside:proton symporter [Accumulibacter sp.]MCM8662360.1 nucleoside:proton symporter [Accumulibacter sp.]HNC52344.1 nucleoside transporter C-terminal domain-containing protein [Accumulibacter sp.]